MSRLKGIVAALLTVSLLWGTACTSVDESLTRTAYDEKTGRLTLIEADTNQNGRPDSWSYMDATRVVRLELDRNEDGRVDRWEYYLGDAGDQRLEKVGFSTRDDGVADAWAYEGATGQLARIEFAGHRDGRVTRTEYYDANRLVRTEEDIDADGRVDRWETFRNGSLISVAFDSDADGLPDRRLRYNADGTFIGIENLQ